MTNFTLKYWLDDGWYVGKLAEIPSVFSQGETIEELQINIAEVYHLMLEDSEESFRDIKYNQMAIAI